MSHVFARLAAAIIGLAVLSLAPATAEPQTYVLDKHYTNVTFAWNHLGLSRQSARILDLEGTLVFDPEKPESSTIEVTLKPQSIITGVGEFDRQLKGPDYFDVGRFPTIVFRGREVTRTGEKTGLLAGDLIIRGITRPVALSVTMNFLGEHPLGPLNATYLDKFVAGFSARAKINRSEWELKRGTPLVSDEVEISIEAELIRK